MKKIASRSVLLASAGLLLTTLGAVAAPITFDFKDPKGVNNIIFKLDAPLESVNGSASGVSGKVVFDPQNPGAIHGTLVVAASSMHVSNPMQQRHLQSDQWLDVARYPEIRFETTKVDDVKTSGTTTTANVTGKMTIKGVTKEVTAPVKITYLKDMMKARSGQEGDLLVLRSTFNIKRTDFGINPGRMEEKVSDEIELSMALAGSAPK